jgi:sensor histidine kinase YesM
MKKQIIAEVRSILLIFLLAGVSQMLLFCWDCDVSLQLKYLFYAGTLWVVIWKANELCVDLSGKFASWLEQPVKRFVIAALLIIVLSCLGYYVVDIFFNVILWGQSIEEFVDTITFEEVYMPALISLVINMFMHGYYFLVNWRQEVVRHERLRNEHLSMQFESLKNQLNPHFLFNSLNALSSLVYDDQGKAVSFIRKLSDVYRYVLDHREKEIVTLDEEMKFVNSYLFLQKIRFSENIITDFDISDAEDRYIPPMAVQLLLENAIKHNVVSNDYPLSISIRTENDYLTVSNSIREKKIKDSTGIGLQNLRERYQFLTQKEVRVLSDSEVFSVAIPLLTFKESNKTTPESSYALN